MGCGQRCTCNDKFYIQDTIAVHKFWLEKPDHSEDLVTEGMNIRFESVDFDSPGSEQGPVMHGLW